MKLYHGTEACLIDQDDINEFLSDFADNHLTFLTTSKEVAETYSMKRNGIANVFEFEFDSKNILTIDCKGLIWDSEELNKEVELQTGEEYYESPDDLSHLLNKYDAIVFKNISDLSGRNNVSNNDYTGDTIMINKNIIKYVSHYKLT